MTYGMLASGSCFFTDIVDQLHEDSKKINSVEPLTRHLNKGVPQKALLSYLAAVRKWAPSQSISIFFRLHSSKEKGFTSVNDITFSAMERGAALFGKATFVMDRGYDDSKMFLKSDQLEQNYVIRLLKDIYLILVYGITKHPMMLCDAINQNKETRSKEDVIRAAKLYFSIGHIEEYFRCKKQIFRF